MSSKNLSDRSKQSHTNNNLKSSIVHKPFDTGTVNIFNPHRPKANREISAPKLFLDAELEETNDGLTVFEQNLEPNEIEYRDRNWLDNLLSPWGISAIAILFLVNLISAGFIWRNARLSANSKPTETPVSTVGKVDFTKREFVPLNLSTLGTIETTKEKVEDSLNLTPIAPALAPINNIASLSSYNTKYHYVLTEYTGEQSLAKVRKRVKQVSLVNFPQGVFIYLGAFEERSQAEQFVSQLKDNFSAHVYPLD